MTVPSRGEDAPGRSQRPAEGGRAQGAPSDPSGPGGPIGGGRRRCGVWPGQPSTCCGRERPGGPGLPAPHALCYSSTSCLRPPTRAHFPGREAAEGRAFLADTRPRAPPSHPEPRPRPGSPGAPLPGTRGRCAAVGAGARGALLGPGPGSQPGEGQLDADSVFILFSRSSLQAPNP